MSKVLIGFSVKRQTTLSPGINCYKKNTVTGIVFNSFRNKLLAFVYSVINEPGFRQVLKQGFIDYGINTHPCTPPVELSH